VPLQGCTLLYYKEVKDDSHCVLVLCTVYPRKTHLIPNGRDTGWAPVLSSLRVISHSSYCSVPKALQAHAVGRRPGFNPRVRIVVAKTAPGQDFLQSQPFSPVTITP